MDPDLRAILQPIPSAIGPLAVVLNVLQLALTIGATIYDVYGPPQGGGADAAMGLAFLWMFYVLASVFLGAVGLLFGLITMHKTERRWPLVANAVLLAASLGTITWWLATYSR